MSPSIVTSAGDEDVDLAGVCQYSAYYRCPEETFSIFIVKTKL